MTAPARWPGAAFLAVAVAAVLLAAAPACHNAGARASDAPRWRASDERGDKPGFGYELGNDNGRISGAAFILDPDHPHDFGRGRRAVMRVLSQSGDTITFRVRWNRELEATLRFELKQPGWPDAFDAAVSEIIDSEPTDTETLRFSRIR
jgi:hypothetical protein